MIPKPPTSRTPINGTPHSPKASVSNPSNSENPSSNSCDYTQVANIFPLPILKGRVTIMDKLKVKVKNLYPQAHACMLAIGLLACVIHQHGKNSSATMAGVKRGETPSITEMISITHPPATHRWWQLINDSSPWGSKLMSSKKFISSLRVPGSMPGPKPLEETILSSCRWVSHC